MGKRIRRLKNVRIHNEGTQLLRNSLILIIGVAFVLWYVFDTLIPFWCFIVIFGSVYCVAVNFFRCPKRFFAGDTEGIVVAPADGKIVVLEEVDEDRYFHDRRIMVSIFMSLFNVHANWIPVDGQVKSVVHTDGNFHRAWLPKASDENEHSDVLIESTCGDVILCRQVAGAVARRIVTYAKSDEDCYVDEHLGFIKFGSRVDLFLPLDAEICVSPGQSTTGDKTVIAKLKKR